MSIDSEEDMQGMRRVGRVVAEALRAMRAAVAAGITTLQLDQVAARVLAHHGARSAPQVLYGFPGVTCISVNDEVVHGVPGDREIHEGDLVKLDVTAELSGYIADAAVTVVAGQGTAFAARLARCAEAAFQKAIRVTRAGGPLNAIGRAVETEVSRRGFTVVATLGGHGVGRAIHEPPHVLNVFDPRERGVLTDGLVITLEPIVSAGSPQVVPQPDRWTLKTRDGSLSAHYEHTIVVTGGRPLLVTAP